MGRPRGAAAADTRERILHVARDVFTEVGYGAATFQEIATRAGLTRPAINHYFPGKKALYEELLERTGRFDVDPAIERARCGPNLIEQLSSFLTAMAHTNAEDRSATRFVVAAMLDAAQHPELRPAATALQSSTREFLTSILTEAVRRGELSTEADVASLVETLSTVLWGVGFYATFVGSDEQVLAVSDNLRKLLGNSLWKLAD